MAPYFGAGGQKAVWDKGLRYFTRGLHPGSPRSPGTFRSTPTGNTCSPGDTGDSGDRCASFFSNNSSRYGKSFFVFEKSIFPEKFYYVGGILGNDAPPVPWVPGVAFPVQHGTGSISKISGGVPAVEKTGAIIFLGTPGTLSVVNLGPVYPKKYQGGMNGPENPGDM